jgi:hypothetical protein
MKNEVLFSSKHLDVEYNPEYKYLYANWKGFQTFETIKQGGEKILELLQTKGARKLLNDNTSVSGPFTNESQEWAAKNWFPRMMKAGLTHFAWIFSSNVFAVLSAEKTLTAFESKTSKAFEDFKAAQQWILMAD